MRVLPPRRTTNLPMQPFHKHWLMWGYFALALMIGFETWGFVQTGIIIGTGRVILCIVCAVFTLAMPLLPTMMAWPLLMASMILDSVGTTTPTGIFLAVMLTIVLMAYESPVLGILAASFPFAACIYIRVQEGGYPIWIFSSLVQYAAWYYSMAFIGHWVRKREELVTLWQREQQRDVREQIQRRLHDSTANDLTYLIAMIDHWLADADTAVSTTVNTTMNVTTDMTTNVQAAESPTKNSQTGSSQIGNEEMENVQTVNGMPAVAEIKNTQTFGEETVDREIKSGKTKAERTINEPVVSAQTENDPAMSNAHSLNRNILQEISDIAREALRETRAAIDLLDDDVAQTNMTRQTSVPDQTNVTGQANMLGQINAAEKNTVRGQANVTRQANVMGQNSILSRANLLSRTNSLGHNKLLGHNYLSSRTNLLGRNNVLNADDMCEGNTLAALLDQGDGHLHKLGFRGTSVFSASAESRISHSMAALSASFIRELYGNILKYADPAAYYAVAVRVTADRITITATDVPRQSPDDTDNSSHSGLRRHIESITCIGGTVDISSTGIDTTGINTADANTVNTSNISTSTSTNNLDVADTEWHLVAYIPTQPH